MRSITPKVEAAIKLKPITVRIPDACRLTGIGRSKLYELIDEGAVTVVKVGSMTLITLDSIESFIEARKVANSPEAS